MSRRKQAKPRSLKRDEEWEDGNEQNVLEVTEQDNGTTGIKQDDEDEEEEEELQRAFSRHSEDYLQDGRPSSVQEPDLENQNSLDSGSPVTHKNLEDPNKRRSLGDKEGRARPPPFLFLGLDASRARKHAGVNFSGSRGEIEPRTPTPSRIWTLFADDFSLIKRAKTAINVGLLISGLERHT